MKKLSTLVLLFGLFIINISKVYATWDDYNEYDKKQIKLLKEKVEGSKNLTWGINVLLLDDYTEVQNGKEQIVKKMFLQGVTDIAQNKARFQERSKDAEQILKLYNRKNKN